MASNNPLLCCPVVLAAAKHIDFKNETTGFTATIAAGTYYSIYSLASAAQTAIATEWGTTGATVAVSTSASTLGKITITMPIGDGFTDPSLLWSSGANASTSLGTYLGYDVSADDTGDNTYPSDYQAPNAWWAERPPGSDTFDRREHIGGQTRRTLSGQYVKRLTVATPRKRKIDFVRISPEYTLARSATGSDTNKDFETVWNTIVSGGDAQIVRYFADQTDSATYTDYYLQDPLDLFDAIRREDIDAETYAWSITLLRQES